MVRHLRSTGRPAVCAPVVNRDVNQLELGRRPWSSPTLDLGRRSRVEEREVDPESGDYATNEANGKVRHKNLGKIYSFHHEQMNKYCNTV